MAFLRCAGSEILQNALISRKASRCDGPLSFFDDFATVLKYVDRFITLGVAIPNHFLCFFLSHTEEKR
jgi:hypothetical protein